MKNIIFIFCTIALFSCSKDASGPGTLVAGSIEYKVNGIEVDFDNANIANGEMAIFSKQLKGLVPATRYLLNAGKGSNNLIGFTIITDSLNKTRYHYDSSTIKSNLISFQCIAATNGQGAGLFFNGDYLDVNITSYKDSRITGTFTAKITPLPTSGAGGLNYNSRGSVVITDGKLNNVQVIY